MFFRCLAFTFLFFPIGISGIESPSVFAPDNPGSGESHHLVWPTEPGVRYELQESTDLKTWITVEGFPSEAEAFSEQHLFDIDGDRRFFRVVKLDDQPPIVPEGMVLIEGGILWTNNELNDTVVSSFEIGRYEVTWGEWKEVRQWAATNGYDIGAVGWGCADDHPVRSVSWYDVVKWCNAKSEREELEPVYQVSGEVYRKGLMTDPTQNLSANGYRLPLEAEWEFAARGGNRTNGYTYAGGNDLNAVAWNRVNSGGSACSPSGGRGTRPVGQKAPNELGLYDMSGNVWEWCWEGGSLRRIRGGGYLSLGFDCNVSSRGFGNSDNRNGDSGLRLARSSGS